jgi:hypothetical protein
MMATSGDHASTWLGAVGEAKAVARSGYLATA